MRSASSSDWRRTASTCGSSISWMAMKFMPTTFQWMCLRVSWRSSVATRRSWSVASTAVVAAFRHAGHRGLDLGVGGVLECSVLVWLRWSSHVRRCPTTSTSETARCSTDRTVSPGPLPGTRRTRWTTSQPDLNQHAHSRPDPTTQRRPDFDVAVLGAGRRRRPRNRARRRTVAASSCSSPDSSAVSARIVACMPTKAMLHDAADRTLVGQSIRRRADVVEHLDDSQHAHDLQRHGAVLVGAPCGTPHRRRHDRSRSVDRYDGPTHRARRPARSLSMPPIDGLDELGDRCWTSADAMITDERPTRLTIVGGGVIGCELATIFARIRLRGAPARCGAHCLPGSPPRDRRHRR